MFDPSMGRILSNPVRVHWAGFESTTYRLQQAGWSFSANQDVQSQTMRIAMRHGNMDLYAISPEIHWHYRDPNFHRDIIINMVTCSRSIMLSELYPRPDYWAAFDPVDMVPVYTQHVVNKLEDLVHFAPSLVRTREILLPEATVPQLLDQILKLQDPAREAEFKRQVAEQHDRGAYPRATPATKVHAQLVSF